MNSDKKVSAIIPAYNEEATIESVVCRLIQRLPECEIIVVNDGSTDETAARASRGGAIVLNHDLRLGYGASIKTGVRNAKGEYVLLCDGDGQHSPDDAALLIDRCDGYDMV